MTNKNDENYKDNDDDENDSGEWQWCHYNKDKRKWQTFCCK